MVTLDVEGGGDDAHHDGQGDDGPDALRLLSDDWRDARTRAAAQSAGDEDKVGARDDASYHVAARLSTASACGRVAAGAHSFGDVTTDEQLLQGAGVVKVLLVGVDRHRDGPLHTKVGDAVQRVVARTAAANDQNAWVRWDEIAQRVVHDGGLGLLHHGLAEVVDHAAKGDVMHAHANRSLCSGPIPTPEQRSPLQPTLSRPLGPMAKGGIRRVLASAVAFEVVLALRPSNAPVFAEALPVPSVAEVTQVGCGHPGDRATLREVAFLRCFPSHQGIVDGLDAGVQDVGHEGVRSMVPFQHGFEVVREFRHEVPSIVAMMLPDDQPHRVHHIRQQAPCFAVRSSSSRGQQVQNMLLAVGTVKHLTPISSAPDKPGNMALNPLSPSRG